MLAKIWGTLAVAVVALGLAGCGDDKSGGGGSAGSGGGGKKKLEEIAAGGVGSLKIKFVYGGTAPAPSKLAIAGMTDAAFCGKHPLVDESLVVGDDGGLANVVVYLRSTDAPVHDSYKAQEGKEVTLTNKGCRFEPHVTTLWTKQKLKIANADTVGHNTNAALEKNEAFNKQIPAESSLSMDLPKSEIEPVPMTCGAHKWMAGHLLVRDNPYMSVSGKDGVLTIENLPTGNWEFAIWHERSGFVKSVKRNGKAEVWSRGRATFGIKPGENDLGTVEIAAELLKKK